MTWLIFLWALTLGVEQTDMLQPTLDWYGYTELEAGVMLWDTVETGGAVKTYILPSHSPFFSPVEANFTFFVILHYQMFHVGYEHVCLHNFQGYYTRDGQGYDRFFVTIGNPR